MPRRLGKEDYYKFKANLGYVVRPTDTHRHVQPQSRVSEEGERYVCGEGMGVAHGALNVRDG